MKTVSSDIPSDIPSTMPQLKHQRADAALRAHHALCAFMLGTQIFLEGTARAPQFSGNAMYLCALSAPVCAVVLALTVYALRRRHDMQPLPAVYRAVWGRFFGGAACLLTGALFLLDIMGALAMLSALGDARLMPIGQGGATYLPALLALFLAVGFSGSGLERLAFLSRRVTPALLIVLSFLLVRRDPLSNLFPLLGRSLPETVQGALCAAGAASCALALGFSPASLPGDGAAKSRTGIRPLLLGSACAVLLLLTVSLSMPASALTPATRWAELLIHTGSYTENTGIFYLLVLLLECFALLCAAAGALRFAVLSFAGVMRMRMACIVCFALTACAAGGVLLCGSRFVLAVLPLRFVPALLLALFTLLADRIRARRAEGRGEA